MTRTPEDVARVAAGRFRWEPDCLASDPFAGDFGDGEVLLTNKMVTNRGGGICHTCAGPCEPGTRNRVLTERTSEGLTSYRWCQLCCFAMVADGLGRSSLADRQQRIGDVRRAHLTRPDAGDAQEIRG